MSVAKTSSLAGANWPMYYTNTYTITLVNTGTLAQTGIEMTDYLPPGTVYVTGSATGTMFSMGATTAVYAASSTFTVPAGVTLLRVAPEEVQVIFPPDR